MEKIITNNTKTLKLLNALVYVIDFEESSMVNEEIRNIIIKMESYIRTKGVKALGPIVQYSLVYLGEDSRTKFKMKLFWQVTSFINHVELPYKMESVIRIPNCMYCRYTGPEEKIKFAYDKILLIAFEEDIPLKGDSYTIIVDRDEENETITADVFMERADNG